MNYKKIVSACMLAICILGINTADAAPKKNVKNKITKTVQKSEQTQENKTLDVKIELSQVETLLENGEYKSADDLIAKIIKDQPSNSNIQSLQTISLALQSKLDDAQEKLNILLVKYPSNPDLHYAQGIVYLKRIESSDMEYRNKADVLFDKAINEFNIATEIDKNYHRAYNASGVAWLNAGEIERAKVDFERAIEIEPKYATAIDNLGTLDFLAGNYDNAEVKFIQSLEYNKNNPTAYYHLAQVSAKKHEYSRALSFINKSLDLNPKSSVAYNLMGEIYNAQGNEAAAIEAFKKSAAIKPENPQPYINLANLYEKRSDVEFAIEQLKTALSVNPKSYSTRLKIADMAMDYGKYNDAIKFYAGLIGVENYHSEAIKGIANCYFEQAKKSVDKGLLGTNQELFDAYNYVNQAIALNPNDLELHLAKLKLADITGQNEQKNEVLNYIINSPSMSLRSIVAKGEAYLALNQNREARSMFDMADNIATKEQDRLYLAEILTYDKQYSAAQKVLAKVLAQNPNNSQALSNYRYIEKRLNYSDAQLQNAIYFKKKEKNKFFMREYLNRAVATNPNNLKANYMLGKIANKQKEYEIASNAYKAALAYEENPRKQKSLTKKINNLDKKIEKINQRNLKKNKDI